MKSIVIDEKLKKVDEIVKIAREDLTDCARLNDIEHTSYWMYISAEFDRVCDHMKKRVGQGKMGLKYMKANLAKYKKSLKIGCLQHGLGLTGS